MKKGYLHSGRKAGRTKFDTTAPRTRYAKAVKSRFHVSAIALNDGTFGPHTLEMGHRYEMVIIGRNADKIERDLEQAGFQVEDIYTSKQYKQMQRINKRSKSAAVAEARSRWAVQAKQDSRVALHRQYIPGGWTFEMGETIMQYGAGVIELTQKVMANLNAAVVQERDHAPT